MKFVLHVRNNYGFKRFQGRKWPASSNSRSYCYGEVEHNIVWCWTGPDGLTPSKDPFQMFSCRRPHGRPPAYRRRSAACQPQRSPPLSREIGVQWTCKALQAERSALQESVTGHCSEFLSAVRSTEQEYLSKSTSNWQFFYLSKTKKVTACKNTF